jgi:hypothetical protein
MWATTTGARLSKPLSKDKARGRLISLLAMTALTQKRWLFYLALAPTAFGVAMGLAGLLGWGLHPDALTRLLL